MVIILGAYSFHVAASTVWISVPANIHACTLLLQFRYPSVKQQCF